jgi:hypothetical protein
MSGKLHAPSALSAGKESSIPIVQEAAWAPTNGLDDVEKRKFLTLPELELRPLRSQSLYRLRYPGFLLILMEVEILNLSLLKELGTLCESHSSVP